MPDEQIFFIQTSDIAAGITPGGNVSLRFGKPHPSLGFDPTIVFAAELTPTEARAIADLLVRKARESEASQTQR